jgi:hypothetical protein
MFGSCHNADNIIEPGAGYAPAAIEKAAAKQHDRADLSYDFTCSDGCVAGVGCLQHERKVDRVTRKLDKVATEEDWDHRTKYTVEKKLHNTEE